MRVERNPQPRAFSVAEYASVGCEQMRDIIGIAIHELSGGFMCNGCPVRQSGCAAYEKLLRGAQAPKATAPITATTETVREEAARRNVSLSEVRRQRAAQR